MRPIKPAKRERLRGRERGGTGERREREGERERGEGERQTDRLPKA